jgi:hypothetical protein
MRFDQRRIEAQGRPTTFQRCLEMVGQVKHPRQIGMSHRQPRIVGYSLAIIRDGLAWLTQCRVGIAQVQIRFGKAFRQIIDRLADQFDRPLRLPARECDLPQQVKRIAQSRNLQQHLFVQRRGLIEPTGLMVIVCISQDRQNPLELRIERLVGLLIHPWWLRPGACAVGMIHASCAATPSGSAIAPSAQPATRRHAVGMHPSAGTRSVDKVMTRVGPVATIASKPSGPASHR